MRFLRKKSLPLLLCALLAVQSSLPFASSMERPRSSGDEPNHCKKKAVKLQPIKKDGAKIDKPRFRTERHTWSVPRGTKWSTYRPRPTQPKPKGLRPVTMPSDSESAAFAPAFTNDFGYSITENGKAVGDIYLQGIQDVDGFIIILKEAIAQQQLSWKLVQLDCPCEPENATAIKFPYNDDIIINFCSNNSDESFNQAIESLFQALFQKMPNRNWY